MAHQKRCTQVGMYLVQCCTSTSVFQLRLCCTYSGQVW